MKLVSALMLSCSLAAVFALGADIYVSKDTGNNQNPGTKEAPLKNIQKAIDNAEPGDIIHVAKGRYFGIMDRGYIELKKSVILLGGYDTSFTTRDILKNQVLIQPTNAANGTSNSKPLLDIQIQNLQDSSIIIDGFIFDKGESNGYHDRDGKPKDVETGMLMHAPTKGTHPAPTSENPLIKGRINGDLIIKNCVFLNGPNYGIQLGNRKGRVTVTNNVFVSNAYSAAEIWGTDSKPHQSVLEFTYNTVLFTWSRTKDLSDMGYGVRAISNMDYEINNNIIGLSTYAGFDNTRFDPNKDIRLNDNLFFLNRMADMTLPSGGGVFMYVKVGDFADVEGFKSINGNQEISDLQGLKDAINKPYLEGFLRVAYSETAAFQQNSPANLFREAMGMNKQGTLTSKVSMYANRYAVEDAIKLVGAVEGYGAQAFPIDTTEPAASQTPPAEPATQEQKPEVAAPDSETKAQTESMPTTSIPVTPTEQNATQQ